MIGAELSPPSQGAMGTSRLDSGDGLSSAPTVPRHPARPLRGLSIPERASTGTAGPARGHKARRLGRVNQSRLPNSIRVRCVGRKHVSVRKERVQWPCGAWGPDKMSGIQSDGRARIFLMTTRELFATAPFNRSIATSFLSNRVARWPRVGKKNPPM